MLNEHLSLRAGSEATTLQYRSLFATEPGNLSSPSCMKKTLGKDIYGHGVLVEIEGCHNRGGGFRRPFGAFAL